MVNINKLKESAGKALKDARTAMAYFIGQLPPETLPRQLREVATLPTFRQRRIHLRAKGNISMVIMNKANNIFFISTYI